jgi:hypothetical protein
MPVLLVVKFKLRNGRVDEEEARTREIVPLIASQKGFISKTWAGNDLSGEFVGVYEFETWSDAEKYLASEVIARLRASDNLVGNLDCKIYDIYRKQKISSD